MKTILFWLWVHRTWKLSKRVIPMTFIEAYFTCKAELWILELAAL